MTNAQKKIRLVFFIVCWIQACAGCASCPSPDDLTSAKAKGCPSNYTECAAVCAHLEEMKCDDMTRSPLGKSCVEICIPNSPPARSGWDLSCVRASASCAAANRCSYLPTFALILCRWYLE